MKQRRKFGPTKGVMSQVDFETGSDILMLWIKPDNDRRLYLELDKQDVASLIQTLTDSLLYWGDRSQDEDS